MKKDTNIVNIEEARLRKIKAKIESAEAHAAQAVVEYCEVGEMLREDRASMSANNFVQYVERNLGKKKTWAFMVMKLSFYKLEAVNHDSFRQAYEAVKGLESDAEKAERATWSVEKGNRGRPKKEPVVQEVTAMNLQDLAKTVVPSNKSQEALIDFILTGETNAKPTTRTYVKGIAQHHEAAVAFLKGEISQRHAYDMYKQQMIANRNQQVEQQKATFNDVVASMSSEYQSILKDEFNRSVSEKIESETKSLREAKAAVESEWTSIRAARSKLNDDLKVLEYKNILTKSEFKSLKGFLHPDRHPENQDKANRLFQLMERLEPYCRKPERK